MKHAKWISALVLLAVPLIAAAQQPTERMATQVPFKFMVGAVEMPAGEYIVQLTDEKGAAVLRVENPEAERSVYVLPVANLGKKSETGAMVFRHYGDRYFLTELRVEDSRTVYTLQPTKLEKEFRAQNVAASEDILLASRP